MAYLKWLLYIFIPIILGSFSYLFVVDEMSALQWVKPGIFHPLGTDEFGRDILASILAATGFSLLKGIIMAGITLILAVMLAEILSLQKNRFASLFVRITANIVESVPVVMWVLIVLVTMRQPRLLVVTTAFSLVCLPPALYIVSGELLRLRRLAYVEAAYLLGEGELKVLICHLLPNAIQVLFPYAIQILGAAIAIDGAIGVIGLGNRADLDLGIFLLRGKENFILHPQLLVAGLIMYSLIYGYLAFLSRYLKRMLNGN